MDKECIFCGKPITKIIVTQTGLGPLCDDCFDDYLAKHNGVRINSHTKE